MNRVFRVIFLLCALAVLVSGASLLAEIRGFEQGYDAAIRVEFPEASNVDFIAHGPNFYSEVSRYYFAASTAIGIYFVFTLVSFALLNKDSIQRIGSFTSLVLLGISIYGFANLALYKSSLLTLESGQLLPYVGWLRSSTRLDLTLCGVVIVLTLGELLSFVVTKRGGADSRSGR